MHLYSFRTVADATFLLAALALALCSLALVSHTLHDHLYNAKYPALQVFGRHTAAAGLQASHIGRVHAITPCSARSSTNGQAALHAPPAPTSTLRLTSEPAQTCCMRILLLAPIYALVSWCMMVLLPAAGYLEVVRDAYEVWCSSRSYWRMHPPAAFAHPYPRLRSHGSHLPSTFARNLQLAVRTSPSSLPSNLSGVQHLLLLGATGAVVRWPAARVRDPCQGKRRWWRVGLLSLPPGPPPRLRVAGHAVPRRQGALQARRGGARQGARALGR